jgi:FAD/FMN-containing dehydrogenase
VEMLSHLRGACGDRLTAFELLSRTCVDAVLKHRPQVRDPLPDSAWAVLVQLGDSGPDEALHALLERALEESAAPDAVLAKNEAEAQALWAIRETVPEAQFGNVKHDISVPVSKIPEFIARTESALRAEALRLPAGFPIYCFGHVGDGNLHYNVGDAALISRREEVSRVVYEVVDAFGGSISAEHGLGQLKRAEIGKHKPALELELMRAVKRALDPQGIMNPGKVV